MKYAFITSDNKIMFIEAECLEKATLEAQWVDKSAQPVEDLFEYYYLLPQELQNVLNRFSQASTYDELEIFLKHVKELGYTFEYYLDAVPFGLTKL